MFNISIDSSSLNIYLSSFLHLLQIIEKTNVFSKMYDILGLSLNATNNGNTNNKIHAKLSNEFLLIHIHQDFYHIPQPLYKIDYFLNKHH